MVKDKSPQASEDRFRRIFDCANDAAFIVDPRADEILDVNATACRMLAYSRQELLSTPVSAIHPREMPALLAFFDSVLQTGRGWTDELTCMTKGGEPLPAEISASIMELEGRRYMLAMVRDIRERKRMEAELKKYSENLERLVEERTARLRRSEERHRALLGINNAIISNLDRESLFAAIALALREALPHDRASLTLHDPERDVLKIYALEGAGTRRRILAVGDELPRKGSRSGHVFDIRQPMRIADLAHEAAEFPEDRLVEADIHAAIVVPLMTTSGAIGTLAVGSRRSGLYTEEDTDFLSSVAEQVALALENMLAYEEIARLKAQIEEEKLYLEEEIQTERHFDEIVGESAAMQKVLEDIETVAPTDATVLITGETGTGKELVARAIHKLSPRCSKPLIRVNCAALPSGLIESELFGHEKGAFTGATARRTGRFELADGGTIFLDEIGELPTELQTKLLRVLQDGELERVGGSPTIRVNVRVVAATNRDLRLAQEEGRFRPDLYYRLAVFPIHLPPLRERREDLPALVRHFAMKHGTKLGKRIERIRQKGIEALSSYSWPGNIRELENVIERAIILTQGGELDLRRWSPPSVPERATRIANLDQVQREHILKVLETTGWKVSGRGGAAEHLGLKPTTLEARMKKLGIHRPRRPPTTI